MKSVILLLATVLCLPAAEYNAGIARVGSEIATSLTARQEHLTLGKGTRLEAESLAEAFKAVRARLPNSQKGMSAGEIIAMAARLNAAMDKNWAATLAAVHEKTSTEANPRIAYLGCAFEVEKDSATDQADGEIKAKLLFILPVAKAQEVMVLDATLMRIGDRYILGELGEAEFLKP